MNTITAPLGDYRAFLEAKIKMAPRDGFDIDPSEVNPLLKPHQRDIVRWAVQGGRRAVFAAFGLGKSVIQLEILRLILARVGGRGLIIAPLGVRQEFRRDAEMLGQSIRFIRSIEDADETGLYITNYETVRDGKLDPNQFAAVSLDEASVLRSYGSKTYQTFLGLFRDVRFRFVCTATPSPNRYKELIHYGGFLGIMDTGQALTRFFQRDSSQAGNLTLYPHKAQEFWYWMSSWAIFIQRPSDLCECSCHAEKNSPDNGSDASSLNAGTHQQSADHGTAGAIAAAPISQHRATSSPGSCSVADACAQSTVGKEREPTSSGRECSADAGTETTRTGKTVVELSRERSIRTAPPARVVTYCRHHAVTVDTHCRSVICRDCGATIDAFDYLLGWAKREEGEVMAITGLRKEREKLEEDIRDLKRQRANAKSSLDRALIAANKAQRGGE